MIKLYDHQELGKKYLLTAKKACLFFEVGTGKTFTALAALVSLPKNSKILIVAPKKVLEHVWLRQSEYDLSDWEVSYINYEKIARDKSLASKTYDCIILDEVHKIKGKTTNTSKRIWCLSKKAKYVWGLTGTPYANNYADIYNIYKHMDIEEFDETYNQFVCKYYYVRPLEKGIYSIPILIAPRTDRLKELIPRIDSHSITKRAKDCIDLPEKKINVWKIEGMNTSKYKEIEAGIFKLENDKRTMLKLESINKAHQAANGFVYNDDSNVVEISYNKKLDVLYSLCSNYIEETSKIIIVYNYKADLNTLIKTLGQNFKTTINVKTFETDEDYQILFLQYSQAEGLNLQFCNHMIFYTYDYSFLKFDQMCGRIYRSGQKNNVTYDILLSSNTIEEKIWRAIHDKQSADEFLKGALINDG